MEILNNKYTKWYFSIVSNAKIRVTEGYVEEHHIIPSSCGGSNASDNLVNLTAREHFICHMLLPKMTSGKNKRSMLYALRCMSNFKNGYHEGKRYIPKSAILYEQLKTLMKIPMSQETKDKMRTAKLGKKLGPATQEAKDNMSDAQKSRFKLNPVSDETKAKLSLSGRGKHSQFKDKTHSSQSKTKMSNSQKGHCRGKGIKHSEAAIASNRQAQLKREYYLISPEGVTHVVHDLKAFCLEHELSYSITKRFLHHITEPIKADLRSKHPKSIGWACLKYVNL